MERFVQSLSAQRETTNRLSIFMSILIVESTNQVYHGRQVSKVLPAEPQGVSVIWTDSPLG